MRLRSRILPLEPPPRDDEGNVIPHDHPGIGPDDGIIRRVSEHHVVTDEKTGGKRLSSMAFKPSTGENAGMSVDLQAQIEEAGFDARAYVTTPRWVGSVRFRAGDLRSENFQVGYDPVPDNPHHGEVWGTFSRAQQRRLRQLCEWFVPINGVVIG